MFILDSQFYGSCYKSNEIIGSQTGHMRNYLLALICHGFLHCGAVLPVILIFPTHICWNFFWRHTSDLHLSNCCEASKPASLLPLLLCVVLLSKYKTFFLLDYPIQKSDKPFEVSKSENEMNHQSCWVLVNSIFKFSKLIVFHEKSEIIINCICI